MVREQKLSIAVHNRAASGRAAEVCKTVGAVVNRGIDSRQQFCDCPIDVVGTAERAYDATFCFRVNLLHSELLILDGSAGNLRPLIPIAPVRISRQQAVCVRQRLVRIVVDVAAI